MCAPRPEAWPVQTLEELQPPLEATDLAPASLERA